MAGPDGGLDYRAMNLEVALYSQPTYLFKVDRTAYVPEPNVDGAVVRFKLRARQQYALQDDLKFLGLVRMSSVGAIACLLVRTGLFNLISNLLQLGKSLV